MIKMRYEELSKVQFLQSVQKLASIPMKNPSVVKIMHIVKHLEKHRNEMRSKFEEDIVKKYAKGGTAIEQPKGLSLELHLPFDALEGKENEALEMVEAFGKREFTIPMKKLTVEQLLDAGEWTAQELIALEPICVSLVVAEESTGE